MAIKVEHLIHENTRYEVIPPLPTTTERGGIIASPKTEEDTIEVKLGNDGKLYVPPSTEVLEVTQEEYNALGDVVNSDGKVYYIKDAGINGVDYSAAELSYDNSTSGLSSSTVQGAIDELKSMIESGGSGTGSSLPSSEEVKF